MMPVEEAIIELLRISGPCCLDDVVAYLPDLTWGRCSELLSGCRGTDGCCFTNSGTRPIRSHSTRSLYDPVQPLARRGGRDDNESSSGLTREVERASGSLTLCASGSDIGRAVPEMERD